MSENGPGLQTDPITSCITSLMMCHIQLLRITYRYCFSFTVVVCYLQFLCVTYCYYVTYSKFVSVTAVCHLF